MQIEFSGVFSSGGGVADINIQSVGAFSTSEGHFAVTTSGRAGAIATYRIDPDGTMHALAERLLTGGFSTAANGSLVVAPWGAETVAFFGSNATTLIGYRLLDNGTFGPARQLAWSVVQDSIAAGNLELLKAWAVLANTPPPGFAAADWQAQTVGFQIVPIGNKVFCITAGRQETGVSVYELSDDRRAASLVMRLGADDGLGVATITAIETIESHGQTWLLIASAGSSSVSVARVGANGTLTLTDHVIDTRLTYLGGVQSMAGFTLGQQAYVVAGGADDGLNLFVITPDGQLVWHQSLGHQTGMGLMNIVSVTAEITGSSASILVTSQNSAGVVRLSLSGINPGVVMTGVPGQIRSLNGSAADDLLVARTSGDTLIGGAGEDVLIAGPGESWLTGGAGRDIFVIRAGSGLVRITDFQRGLDVLDLSDLTMLRSTGQLTFTPTASGGRIVYRTTEIILQSADGQPLTLTQIFPLGFTQPDRVFFPSPTPDPPQDPVVQGSSANDTLEGTPGNDTIHGNDGNDLIYGRRGHDRLFGGDGADTLYGDGGDDFLEGGDGKDWLYGGDGNDTMYGGRGADRLFGGNGDNLLHGDGGADRLTGGPGRDTLFGGADNDTLIGGTGPDLLYGDAGNDILNGQKGNDGLYGGDGNDVLNGGRGKDSLFGGAGRDTLIGGLGKDDLYGGAGADVFVWNSLEDSPAGGPTRDFVHDFEAGLDRLDISGLGQNLVFVAAPGGTPGQVWFNARLARLAVDINGDNLADFQVQFADGVIVTEADLIL